MTREETTQEILELSDRRKYLMLNLPTGYGKSKICIDIIKRHYGNKILGCNVLIVVPKNVLKDNWRDELEKWEFPQAINVQFTTYISYPKYADQYWDCIVFDEAQHFTENCEDATTLFQYDRVLAVSATIPNEAKWRLKGSFSGIYQYSVSAREAIDSAVLPDPKVLLIPLMLDNTIISETFVVRKSRSGTPIVLMYNQRSMRFRYPNRQVHIRCTQQQYYNIISDDAERNKTDYIRTQAVFRKNMWLRACKDRLTFLAEKKEPFVLDLLNYVKDYRTLTFCTSIEQTKKLGDYPISSDDNKQSMQNLADFNEGKIDHITTCSMLNEGVNLSSCQVGIHANIGSSEVAEIQKLGRLLRHKNPLIIVPFYAGTREEEIVDKMMRNYNPLLVTKLFKSQVTKEVINNIINGESSVQQAGN